ncbi:hypothetical protein CPB97_002386, partial [Podila verticillata]
GTPERDQRLSPGTDGYGSGDAPESGKRKLDSTLEEGRVPKRQQRLSHSPQPDSPLSPQEGVSSVLEQPETSTSNFHRPDQSQSNVTEANPLAPSPGHFQPGEGPTEVTPDQGPSRDEGSDLEPGEIPEPPATEEEPPQKLLFACAARFRGHYNDEKNKLTITLTSSAMAESFYSDIRSNTFLNRLELSLAWDWTEEDLASFSNTIIHTNITQFVLDGKGQPTENQQFLNRGMYGQYGMIFGGGYTTPPRVGEEVGSGFGTRFNPLIRLLGHTTVTKFHVMGMPEFLKEFSCDLPEDLTHLEILQVDLNISDWSGIHAQRFSDLIKRSTSLNCLVLGCPPDKYHAHLDHAREALIATPTPRTYPIQIQLFSKENTHVSTDFNQDKEMFRMCVHLARSERYDVYWVPILESTLTHRLRELRLDYLMYETDYWAKALLCWLKERWSNKRNRLEVLRMNWSTVRLDTVPMLKFMFDLVEEHELNVKISDPCMQALQMGYENAAQEARRRREAMH